MQLMARQAWIYEEWVETKDDSEPDANTSIGIGFGIGIAIESS